MKNKVKRIMVVDDEIDLCEILTFNLESEGYEVVVANSGEQALQLIDLSFDLILLDVMMEGISGYKTAEKIRKERQLNVPIIFLTAKVTENDMLTGFSIGADDYINKPFSLKEVLARVKAVIRRNEMSVATAPEEESNSNDSDVIVVKNIVINKSNMKVTVDGNEVMLTKKEYDILLLLASAAGRNFAREDILKYVWKDESFVLERTVDVHITRLRKKIGDNGSMITNRSGYGYSINND